jgi:hypothetical protein
MAHAHHHVKRRVTPGEGTNIFVARAIYIIFAIIITFIVVRMILLMMGADPIDPFANFIYMVSSVFVVPFFLMFGYTPTYGAPVFEISSIVAMLVYILVGWGLAILVTFGSWHTDEV